MATIKGTGVLAKYFNVGAGKRPLREFTEECTELYESMSQEAWDAFVSAVREATVAS